MQGAAGVPDPQDVVVATLGDRRVASPLKLSPISGDGIGNFVPDSARVRYQIETPVENAALEDVWLEKAGPRQQLFFDPAQVRAAIVTCGGLCPGLNNVVRAIFLELFHNYGVRDVLGIRFGYQGLNPAVGHPPVQLTPDFVSDIHTRGGTVLGSSRGGQPADVVVDFLVAERINCLFCIGGDGTQRGAHAIAEEVGRRGLAISVIGIPKTIDNDLMYATRTFGFATALEVASEVIDCAHAEARGVPAGIGLVKLMGRGAGYIAAAAAVASQDVNFVVIPETPLVLDGENGLLAALEHRLRERDHAVVVVAEGAGQDLFAGEPHEHDASGNVRLHDVGLFVRDRIKAHFAAAGMAVSLKYIDPSYVIRSVRANSADAVLCSQLGRRAVHAAMAGKTDMMVGHWNNVFIHAPIPLVVSQPRRVDLEGELWQSVMSSTGQPRWS
ncbi:MAG: ATP-dependent 6-phosphofructokinase [Pirellulales bacterium]|nr:ATP-dependent 6-phosphofructokinase [Planctomycetales bacterium]